MNKVIYLDNAATSFPKPAAVEREVGKCIRKYCVSTGRGSHKKSHYADEKMYETRERLASLFNIEDPSRIAFTLNTTQGINEGLYGTLSPGDELIISSMEHNSVLRPATELEKRGINLKTAETGKSGKMTFKAIEPLLTDDTKMVAMLHASNVTGAVNEIRVIGRELKKRGILFLVDAAQTAGLVPIDVKKDCIDILCFPGHKGLLGPAGTGGIYVRKGVAITPLMQGGTGSISESSSQPPDMPDLLESGTQNILGIAGLCEGVKCVSDNAEAIYENEAYLSSLLAENLAGLKGVSVLGRDGGRNTGIVGVKLDNISPAEAAYYLDRDFSVAVRAGFHCAYLASKTLGCEKNGTLRFSVGPFNTKKDIEKASYAMFKIISRH